MGVLYPESGRYGITDAHHELASALTGGPTAAVSGKKPKEISADIVKEAEITQCDKIILSSEHFIWVKDFEVFLQLFREWDVHIVCYLRRQDYQALSLYCEWVSAPKGRYNDDFLSFLSQGHYQFDYKVFLSPITEVFGVEALDLVIYEQGAAGGYRLIDSFLKTIKVKDLESADHSYHNKSDGRAFIEAMSLIDLNAVEDVTNLKSKVRMALQDLNVKDAPYFEILSPVARRSFCERFLDSNEYVAKHFLKIPNGRLFAEPLPSIEGTWKERVLDDEARNIIKKIGSP